MRTIFLLIVLFSVASAKAQVVMPAGLSGFTPTNNMENNRYMNDSLTKKWSLTRYNSISTSFMFFKGGNATIISAPMGLQLTRMINKNLYAFAGVSVAPAYVNFRSAFIGTDYNKMGAGNRFSGASRLGVYSAASMGLMYINNDKTFSISGSVSIERSNIPGFLIYPTNNSAIIPTSLINR
ncbi:MAG: hypothetical protein ABIN94_03055 [Ferruginibacter sp.]